MATTFEVHGRMGIHATTGVRYLAHNLVVSGTFDPAEPGVPNETFSDTKWSSGRTGGLNCTATFVETNDEGTATVTVSFNAIAIR